MKVQLFAETDDPEFFKKAMHELGTTVYTVDDQGNIKDVLYFSGSKIVKLHTENIPEDLAKIIKVQGHLFNTIEIDVASGFVFLK